MLPHDFPYRFFSPLVSKHRDDYVHVLLTIEAVFEQAKRIALGRNALAAELRRIFHRESYALDVSDEEDYDQEPTGDTEQDNLAFVLRRLLRCGWIDTDESGDQASDSIFITLYGKKLTGFLKDLSRGEDQSGHVVNTFSNLQLVRTMAENGFVCIQNAYESTQRLLTALEMMYSKIKQYYTAVLANSKPEELLSEHLHGYVRDVVDKLIFPIKVDDSVDRFKGPILNAISDIESDTPLLERVIAAALQTKRVSSMEEGWEKTLSMLSYMKHNFDDIESYMQQLDEKNQTYIRITRQALSYMLSMDTSIKGDIISLLRNAREYPEDDWQLLNGCISLYDIRQVSEEGFYRPRKRHQSRRLETLDIDTPQPVSEEEIDAMINNRAARFTRQKINQHALELLGQQRTFAAADMRLAEDDDYLMAIFFAMNGSDPTSVYEYEAADHSVDKGIYRIPHFTLSRKDDKG